MFLGKSREKKPSIENAELNVVSDDICDLPEHFCDLPLLLVFQQRLQVRELLFPAVDLTFYGWRGDRLHDHGLAHLQRHDFRRAIYGPTLKRARSINP